MSMTPEDFTYLATLIRDNRDNIPVFRALMSNNFNTILSALDLAGVGLAAIAYHDAKSGLESWRLAQRLDETIARYKEALK
jgi:hypothetical protein